MLEEFPDVLVLTDEIYDEVFLGEGRCTSLLEAAPQLRDRVLIVNGVSKTYAMTGWRLGYCAGPKPVVAAINKLQSHMSSCPSSISQAAAAEALTGDQTFVAAAAQQYRARRDLVVSRINAIDGLHALAGDGAFYVFIDCSGVIGRRTPSGAVIDSDDAFVGYLLEQARVATITGSAYGLSPFFRVSFATSEATLAAAMDAIADAVFQQFPGRRERLMALRRQVQPAAATAWRLVAVLCLASMVSTLDRGLINLVVDPLKLIVEHFHLLGIRPAQDLRLGPHAHNHRAGHIDQRPHRLRIRRRRQPRKANQHSVATACLPKPRHLRAIGIHHHTADTIRPRRIRQSQCRPDQRRREGPCFCPRRRHGSAS